LRAPPRKPSASSARGGLGGFLAGAAGLGLKIRKQLEQGCPLSVETAEANPRHLTARHHGRFSPFSGHECAARHVRGWLLDTAHEPFDHEPTHHEATQ